MLVLLVALVALAISLASLYLQLTRAVPLSRSAQATTRISAAQSSIGARQTAVLDCVAQSADGSRAASSARHSRTVDQVIVHPEGRGDTPQHSSRRVHTASVVMTHASTPVAVVQASAAASGCAGCAGAHAERMAVIETMVRMSAWAVLWGMGGRYRAVALARGIR